MIEPARVVGRYALYAEIAAGGMATVHFGRLLGPVGFSRTVAVKRLHPQFAKDADFVTMFLDEARIAARIRHPNVVGPLDVVATEGELFLVMDYVHGESLSRLGRGRRVPPRIAASILCGALHGLHAAHEARNEQGEPLHIVHRDISPQNILVGVDGIARVLDFGVAKARGRVHTTRDGSLRGKLPYMAPEQFRGVVDRRTDIYAAAIVAWEALTGKTLFVGQDEAETMAKVLRGKVEAPSEVAKELPGDFDAVVLRGLNPDPDARYATAREMAMALEKCAYLASPSEVGEWVAETARAALAKRAARISEIESSSLTVQPEAASLLAELQSANDPSVATRQAPRAEAAGRPAESAATFAAAVAATPARGTSPRLLVNELVNEPSSPATYPSAPASWVEPGSAPGIGSLPAPTPERPPRRARWAVLLAVPAVVAAFVLASQWRSTPVEPREGAQLATAAAAPPADTPPSQSSLPVPSAAPASASASGAPGVLPGAALSQPSTLSTAAPRPLGAQKGAASKPEAARAPVTTGPSAAKDPGPPRARPTTAPAAPAKPGCDPPYTLDAMGHRRYRVECL